MPRRVTEIEKASVSNPGAPTTYPAILQGKSSLTSGTDWNSLNIPRRVLAKARRLAREGPRVAAVLQDTRKPGVFAAVPGFICGVDNPELKGNLLQVALVDPDGVVYLNARVARLLVQR